MMEFIIGFILGLIFVLLGVLCGQQSKVNFSNKVMKEGVTLTRTHYNMMKYYLKVENMQNMNYWTIKVINVLQDDNAVIGEYPDGTQWYFTAAELYYGGWKIAS